MLSPPALDQGMRDQGRETGEDENSAWAKVVEGNARDNEIEFFDTSVDVVTYFRTNSEGGSAGYWRTLLTCLSFPEPLTVTIPSTASCQTVCRTSSAVPPRITVPERESLNPNSNLSSPSPLRIIVPERESLWTYASLSLPFTMIVPVPISLCVQDSDRVPPSTMTLEPESL